MAIDVRLRSTITAAEGMDDDELHAAQQAELDGLAILLGAQLNETRIRVEVEYPSEREPGQSWEISGDALEVDLSTTPPTWTTLPPYAEKAP